jgi:hypothetical protein
MTTILVEIGKRHFPSAFPSDVNAVWSVVFATALNAGNAAFFGGDVRLAISQGVVIGLTTAGAYRAISQLSNRNSASVEAVVASVASIVPVVAPVEVAKQNVASFYVAPVVAPIAPIASIEVSSPIVVPNDGGMTS